MNDQSALQDPAFDARIENLELKLMDLENTVHELNEVILQQYRDIERMQLQQVELMNRMHGSTDSAATPSITDELPPHY
ncbi:SlyX family protein [Granulosicoccus sp. 3-233]|uniref:SlyX family protein n=1 Tax=Granulosicoccus sp. 3-233 TaxID=3417969 RepID=UPI003D354CA1